MHLYIKCDAVALPCPQASRHQFTQKPQTNYKPITSKYLRVKDSMQGWHDLAPAVATLSPSLADRAWEQGLGWHGHFIWMFPQC